MPWPNELLVWEAGSGWDGIAIPPPENRNRTEALRWIRRWLIDIGEAHESETKILDSDNWTRYAQDPKTGLYGPWDPSSDIAGVYLHYLPDSYG